MPRDASLSDGSNALDCCRFFIWDGDPTESPAEIRRTSLTNGTEGFKGASIIPTGVSLDLHHIELFDL